MPLLEDVSTERRITFMREIADSVSDLLQASKAPVPIDEVIYSVADLLRMSPTQVHYGINFGIRDGRFAPTSDGVSLIAS